jgi:hypothetical protein
VTDPAKQLQAIYLAGFEIQTFDRFPNAVGVTKGSCIALVQATESGLKLIGQPGWHMGEVMGVLVRQKDKNVFQAKDEVVEASQERLEELESFSRELNELMSPHA